MQPATAPDNERSAEVHLDDLRRAVRSGDNETVRVILSVAPELAHAASRRGGSLLLEAHEREHAAVAESFLSMRERAGGEGLDIHEAAALGRCGALGDALESDPSAWATPGPAGFYPLHLAAFAGDPACVERLLDAGADADARSKNGGRLTPLHSAIAGAARAGDGKDHKAVVRGLLARGADPELEMEGGWTAHAAAERADLGSLLGPLLGPHGE